MDKNTNYNNIQPLRIASGWRIQLNDFLDINPEKLNPNENFLEYNLKEDILYLYNTYTRRIHNNIEEHTISVDLSWYPSGNPEGSFKLLAILDNNWEKPILEFSSRNKDEIVEHIEKWLFEEFIYPNVYKYW